MKKQIDSELLDNARSTQNKLDRDNLIVASMFLVAIVLSLFLKDHDTFRFLRDDLESAGTVGLVKGVDAIIAVGVDDPTAYVKTAIRNEMFTATGQNDQVRTPRGKEPVRYDKRTASNSDEIVDGDTLGGGLLDDILDSCSTDQERSIVSLLAQSYSVEEIAEQLGISVSTVYRSRKQIWQRL